ncbi:MAG: Calcium-translocating P-type ATPase, PMCA-type [Candidatus Magasanikbacteria bacterium GW2011_GWD2_43_18]|nr:MAG: Calcium-translocating P-type ATPase, PMCA-type [Candidatus Magasanikbacteria bacterium GW2011_GWD2_43_18]
MQDFFAASTKDTLSFLHLDEKKGLSGKEVTKRQQTYGRNIFPRTGLETTRFVILLSQFKSTLMIVLICAGIVSGLLHEYIDMTVIFITAFFNVVIGYIQENKADQALKRLRDMVSYKTTVIRDGKKQHIDTADLVPGDIMLIEAGDKIQADARLLEVHELEINESTLTGESEPIAKHTKKMSSHTALGDRKNMIHRGTVVAHGKGIAVVTAIGKHTQIGQIATLVQETKDEKTPLQEQLVKMSRVITLVVIGISIAIFAIGTLVGSEDMVMLFETAVAVAVAAIPEGLVISLTVILAVGMRFILGRNALVRKLVAAETLGSVSVICTDKTGTITEGNMAVTRLVTLDHDLEMNELLSASHTKKESYADIMRMLRAAVIANDGTMEEKTDGELQYSGDTTDTAILFAGNALGMDKRALDATEPTQGEIPFSSERKYMAAEIEADTGSLLYVKGAPEVLWSRSSHVHHGGKDVALTPAKRKALESLHDELTADGLRVIGVGYRMKKEDERELKDASVKELVFLGFLALSDPVREGVKETLALAERAGIRTIMITGDHVRTAKAIAASIGLPVEEEHIFDGARLESLSDQELEDVVAHASVFARVDPIHKIRIVRALQSRGEVVAMTGDGVNDAPAIKGADIGIALGSGTDVAKETSDMVLLDDGFPTIVAAVEEGRSTYQNIKKVILYLLSGSTSEVVLVTGSILAGFPIAALPAQILWINLIQDSFPNMALAFDKGEKDPPRKKRESLIDKDMRLVIIFKSILENILLFSIFVYMWKTTQDIHLTRTIVFVGFGIDALFYIFSIRSLRRYIWQIPLFDNMYLIAAVLLGWVMLVAAVYAPPLQYLLRTVPLEAWHWAMMIGFGLINVCIIEGIKRIFFLRKKRYTL